MVDVLNLAPERLFRVMMIDTDGFPCCGAANCMLGARVPVDIKVDDDGRVIPGTGGISVTPDDPAQLPFFHRPLALGGKGALPLFSIRREDLGQQLLYRPDPRRPSKHGLVEPRAIMLLSEYQAALQATRPRWRREA